MEASTDYPNVIRGDGYAIGDLDALGEGPGFRKVRKGLDVTAFDQCVDTGKSTARIRKDIAEAQKVQASGTPTFFVGLTDSNGTQVKGARLVGAQPYQTFKEAIDRLLSPPK